MKTEQCFFSFAQTQLGTSKRVMNVDIVRIHIQCRRQMYDGLIELPLIHQRQAQIISGVGMTGIETNRLLKVRKRLDLMVEPREHHTVVIVDRRLLRPESNRVGVK